MPKYGEVTRPDGSKDEMIFEFTGDDDMWVYVDGVLVLDLGGIHDAQSGYINFTTGKIGWTDTKTSDTSAQWKFTTIKEQFTAAGQENSVVWSSQRSNTFADGGLHNIQVFYMERGAGASNLKLRLNLPTIPEGSLLIRKNVENYYHPQMQDLEYTMQVKVGGEVYANQAYYIYPDNTKTFTTDSDGKFILKHDQTAVFENVAGGATVTVEETAVQPEPGASGRIDDLYLVSDYLFLSNLALCLSYLILSSLFQYLLHHLHSCQWLHYKSCSCIPLIRWILYFIKNRNHILLKML